MDEKRKDELVRGSFILFFMVLLYNIFNYLFQMSMARMLGPADFGILAVLLAFVYIFGIPSEAIQTIISKYTSKYNIKNEYGKMKDLLYRSMKKSVLFSFILFIIFLPIAYFLSFWLKINFWLLALTGLIIFYSFTIPIIRGLLQGRKKFTYLGGNLVIEGFFKVTLSILIVFIGFKIYGAIFGILIALVIAFIASWYMIKEITKSKRKDEFFPGIYGASFLTLTAITAIVLMYSMDIILAKIFFNPETSGIYSFVSMMGKAILFISLAVGKAMFPLSSENYESGKKTFYLLKKSVLIVSLISLGALVIYFLFPTLIIRIISLGSLQYISGSNILFILGLTFSLLSIANIIVLYNISVNKLKLSAYALLFFALLQILLMFLFHSNVFEFSIALLVSSIIIFLYSLFLVKK